MQGKEINQKQERNLLSKKNRGISVRAHRFAHPLRPAREGRGGLSKASDVVKLSSEFLNISGQEEIGTRNMYSGSPTDMYLDVTSRSTWVGEANYFEQLESPGNH